MHNKSFCVLCPSDLIHYISTADSEKHPDVQDMVDGDPKITLLASGMTWIIHSPHDRIAHQIHALETSEDLKAWITAQGSCPELKTYTPEQTHTRGDGLKLIIERERAPAKTYVPKSMVEKLIVERHVALNHLGPAKILADIRQSFVWPTVRRDVHERGRCETCALAKAKRDMSHGTETSVRQSSAARTKTLDWIFTRSQLRLAGTASYSRSWICFHPTYV